jgi:hypothetical protein
MRLLRGRRSGRLGLLLAALAASAALAALLLPGALAQVVRSGNLIFEFEGKISPTKLPRKTPAPVTLSLEGHLKTADGSHPPVIKSVYLEFDKHGHLNTKGLASCTVGKLENTLTTQAKKACGAALIGTGTATAQIAFPEQAPFSASGPLLIFNGSKGAKQMLIFHVYAHVPAPTTFVTTAKIGKAHGRYGTSASIQVPTIVSGQGSLTDFKATIHKNWTYRGQKQSVLLASCPSGHLYAHGDFLFANGEKLEGEVTRSCTPKG